MKYIVSYSNRFEKSLRLCSRRGLPIEKVTAAIKLLADNGTLPRKYRPHKLTNFEGGMTWECHIEPDWLLVWEQNDNRLTLLMLDTDTHTDIF